MSLFIDISDILEHPGAEKDLWAETDLKSAEIGERNIEFIQPIVIKGSLRNVSRGILAVGDFTTVVRLECSRCLDRYELRVNGELEELFVFRPEGEADEEKDVFPIRGNKIDLEPVLYQLVISEIPFKPVCRPDCGGICPTCGKNKNKFPHVCQEEVVDIRMSKLKDYFKKSKEG